MIAVDGLRVAYERCGEGPPLVLLHGYVGDGPTTWRPQIEALSDEFTVVASDAPGAGRSSDPPESFGMAGYADCLAGFVERLGLERPHIAGLSFGGALALEFHRRHPAIPRTLILASGYAGGPARCPPTPLRSDSNKRFCWPTSHPTSSSVRDALPQIDIPTLLVCGDRDVRAPLAVAEDLHAAISGSTLVVLRNTGHVCNIEAAAAFNDAVRSFLRANRS